MFLAPWNAVECPPVKSRRRLARSCDACYSRKTRCDAAKPRCSWCTANERPCTYQRIFGDGHRAPPANALPAVTEELSPSFARNLQAAGPHLGNICTFNGMPVLAESSREWIRGRTGEEFALHKFSADVQGWNLSLPGHVSHPGLPDLDRLAEEVQLYLSSPYGMFFPVIDAALFQSTLNAAYQGVPSPISPGINSARACVLALHALALLVVQEPERFSKESSIDYAREAYNLLPDLLTEGATLDGLQALLLLCLCTQGLAGDSFIIDYLLSTASRFVMHLKGNLSPPRAWDCPFAANYHARHLFWITFVCDKGFSLVTGLAPRLDEAQCDLQCKISEEARPDTLRTPHLYGDPVPGSFLRSYADLAVIQSRIYLDLYSPSGLMQTDAALLRKIRDLDCWLEEWRLSLPPGIRPSPLTYSGESVHTFSPETGDMRASVFHLQYHHCMSMIHQTSSRCHMWTQNQNTQGGSSSLAIAVAASRSLLGGFVYSPLKLGSENILFSLSYFLQASFIIFCKVVSHTDETGGAGNEQDLQFLHDAAQHITALPRSGDPACYKAKINFAADVMSELGRLGQCAIDRRAEQTVPHLRDP